MVTKTEFHAVKARAKAISTPNEPLTAAEEMFRQVWTDLFSTDPPTKQDQQWFDETARARAKELQAESHDDTFAVARHALGRDLSFSEAQAVHAVARAAA